MQNEYTRERPVEIAEYMLKNEDTVRGAAVVFGIGKSTVHKDLKDRLPNINRALYARIEHLLAVNKAERHLRGGEATKRKYKE